MSKFQNKLLAIGIVVILVTSFYLYISPTANAALTRVQASTGLDTTFASSCQTAAFASPLTNPSIIMFTIEVDTGAANTVNTPTDTAGNTYVRVKSVAEAGVFDLEVWYALNTHTTAGNKVTATDGAAGSDGICGAEEWTGAVTVSPVDQSVGISDAGSPGTALDSGAMTTTTNANDLIWNASAGANAANGFSLGANFTNLTQDHTAFSNLGFSSRVVSATGAYHGLMTQAPSASWIDIAVAIQQAASAGTTQQYTRVSLPNGRTSIDSSKTFVFNSTTTWTCPSDISSVTVYAWGAGGGGGQGTGGGNTGDGAGGGAFSLKTLSVTPGTAYTVTVGTGGTGGIIFGANGTSGGDSWFSTTTAVLAKGGAGAGLSVGGAAAQGGQASAGVGDVRNSGGNGGAGDGVNFGGGGGGGAGTTGNGGNGAGTQFGLGASIGGGNGGSGTTTTIGLPLGGGGAGATSSGNGANGANGAVWIIYNGIGDSRVSIPGN